jgi:hypothetical protein
VFDAWKSATGRNGGTVLDAKRTRLITAALKTYPIEDVLDAVRGWRNDPFHRGENPNGRAYNDLGLLLRDTEHIEKFRDLARQPTARAGLALPGPVVSTPHRRTQAAIDSVFSRLEEGQ